MSLTLDEKARLVTGRGAWATSDLEGKVDAVRMHDGPHGLRALDSEGIGENNDSKPATCYPTASAIACSWDAEAVEKMAQAIAEEAAQEQVDIVLGPGINMKRSPLCGRNFEYYSEDPYLAGQLGTAYVNAMQGRGIGTSLKHFAGNSQETQRMTANSQIDKRALHEIYLSAFEQVVKEAGPTSIMASYNRLNGQFACRNSYLLTKVLRDQWNYQGCVISDWGACNDLAESIQAGMDLEMPDSGRNHIPKLKAAVQGNAISEDSLDRAVKNVLSLAEFAKSKSGLRVKQGPGQAHSEVARELAAESAVLLENDGILPLAENQAEPIVIIGEMAEKMRFEGGGSSHINATKQPNFLKVLEQRGIAYTYAKGYYEHTDKVSDALEQEALEMAGQGKTILFFGGLTENFEGEGYDRKTLAIPENQTQLLIKLHDKNAKIIFVGMGGSPADYSFTVYTSAVLQMYLGGQEVDEACADILFGKVNPSGKLAETFPHKLEDTPAYDYFGKNSDDVEYRESIFIGYRYYDTFHVPVKYCFGHGLSYTSFAYSDLQTEVCPESDTENRPCVKVTFKVTNEGTVAGKEICQVYVKNPKGNFLRADRELRGFQKVALAPGETKTVELMLGKAECDRSFQVFDVEKEAYVVTGGSYQIQVGASIQDIRLTQDVEINAPVYQKDEREVLKEYFDALDRAEQSSLTSGNILEISAVQFETLYGEKVSHLDERGPGEFTTCDSLARLMPYSKLARTIVRIVNIALKFMFHGKPKEDPEVMMFYQGVMEGTLDCIVCQSGGMVPYSVAEKIVKQANRSREK